MVAGLATGFLVVGLLVWSGRSEVVTPPAILPAPGAVGRGPTPAGFGIPEGLLQFEARTASPLNQDGMRWTRTDDADLPPLISPCGSRTTGAHDAVAARQIALVGPTLWKAERLLVYADAAAAARAFDAQRAALARCARHDTGDGTSTVWSTEPIAVADEALFVTGQRYRREDGVPGNHRGVLIRQGRTIVMYVDFGQRTEPARLADVPSHVKDARAIAAKLDATWP